MACNRRVDPGKKVGTIGLDSGLPRAAIKRVVEDVVERFPGVRFTVFHESDYGVGLQEFWAGRDTRLRPLSVGKREKTEEKTSQGSHANRRQPGGTPTDR